MTCVRIVWFEHLHSSLALKSGVKKVPAGPRAFCSPTKHANILWMDRILHHFETMAETIVGWYHCWLVFTGKSSETRVSERWCERKFRHGQGKMLLRAELLCLPNGPEAPHTSLPTSTCCELDAEQFPARNPEVKHRYKGLA